jgi:hypothetical protein
VSRRWSLSDPFTRRGQQRPGTIGEGWAASAGALSREAVLEVLGERGGCRSPITCGVECAISATGRCSGAGVRGGVFRGCRERFGPNRESGARRYPEILDDAADSIRSGPAAQVFG